MSEIILDLTEICKGRRIIKVGDLHGCYDELQKLLTDLDYQEGVDVIVFTGDLIDRGPKILECLEFAMNKPLVYTEMSNHEWKLLRHLKGNKVKAHSLRCTIAQCDKLIKDPKFIPWLEGLPLIIKLPNNQYVVHAGINPTKKMTEQKKEFLIFARNYDPATDNFACEDKSKRWYNFPYSDGHIFFGHTVHAKPDVARHATALDGGCVYGHVLRAHITNIDGTGYVAEVKAAKRYYVPKIEQNEIVLTVSTIWRYHANMNGIEEQE